MKKIFSLALILFFAAAVFAQQSAPQQKPLSQTEYVQMLYDLQKKAIKKEDVVEAVRRRGIDFPLTSGLRSLTSSKSGNDAELRRTLEESARRRENPTAAQLPSAEESANLLAKSREATLLAVEEMPDFVVKQMIQRGASYAGTNNFRNLDRLIVAVSYRAEGKEEYRVLSLNGIMQAESRQKQSYEEVGGTSSTGEFVTVLATIFKPESEAVFEIVDTDTLRGRRAAVFNYTVTKEKARQQITAYGYFNSSATTGMTGKIWIDRENFRVLRIESQATEIPEDFPIRAASRTIDYDWVTISDEKYLLPSQSDVRLTFRQSSNVYETRNLIRFRDYQKYGSEVRIIDEDEIIEEKPNQ